MKRFLALAALVLGLASCQTEPEGLNVNVGGEVDTFVTIAIPDVDTRANSAESGIKNLVTVQAETNYTIRYIFEVYYGETGVQKQVYYTDNMTASFPVRLVPGRDYNFVAWADIVEEPANIETNKALPYEASNVVEKHYNATYLNAITLNNTWVAMDETRDAYTGFHNTTGGEKYTGTSSINIQMTRPFAKLRVQTTDLNVLENLGLSADRADVVYTTKHYSSFNALTGVPFNKNVEKSHEITNISAYGENGTLFVDYFFATKAQEIVNFTLAVYDNDEELALKENNFSTPIPAQRNYLTTISGNILTDGNNVKVDVQDAFANYDENGNLTDPNYEYATISSEAELLEAIDNGGKYIVISDIDVTGLVASTQAATRTTGTGVTTTINLNGYTITLKNNIEVESGNTLIINDEPNDEGNEEGTIISAGGAIVNNGTLNIENGNIESNSTNDAPAIVNNGTLNIEGGNFGEDTIENGDNGVVNITGGTFVSNPSDFVDDDYTVVNDNGEFTLVQKEEAVEINGTKYRSIKKAVAAAQNGETVKFILDVEQEDGILITDKNITIDLNEKTFTVTNGANTNNRNFKVNGSSVVTIKNGTMVADGEYSSGAYGTLRTEGTAKVTLENVELYNYRGNGLNIKALNNTSITINNSEIYSVYGGGIEAAGGTIVLNNVKVEQEGMYTAPYNSMAISVNGGGTVTVNSGTYSTKCITAEEANNQGTSHGPWCAGVLNSGGTLIIKGGTFSNDNYGENALATHARGLLLADTGANIQIENGTFNAVKSIIDIHNNLGDASKNPTATISGGDFSSNPLTWDGLISVAKGHVVEQTTDGRYTVVEDVKVAKVGNTEYRKIEDAIAAWTNNSTLTLLADVTLSDVVTLNSTEHHILDLGTYTLTAASGKHAIEITPEGDGAGTAARSCLTINADKTNPGSIDAGSKSCIYYKKTNSINDRIMVTINGGVYNGSISSSSDNGGQACPYFVFNGGVFNKSVNLTKAMLKVTGGVFHASFSCTGDSTAYRQISGGRFKSWLFMTADASNKFWVGTAKATYDVGVYVDKEGYLVVGGPVITEFGDKFAAKATNATKWSSYLKYSSAAANGLYYEDAEMAIKKHGEANVVLK